VFALGGGHLLYVSLDIDTNELSKKGGGKGDIKGSFLRHGLEGRPCPHSEMSCAFVKMKRGGGKSLGGNKGTPMVPPVKGFTP